MLGDAGASRAGGPRGSPRASGVRRAYLLPRAIPGTRTSPVFPAFEPIGNPWADDEVAAKLLGVQEVEWCDVWRKEDHAVCAKAVVPRSLVGPLIGGPSPLTDLLTRWDVASYVVPAMVMRYLRDRRPIDWRLHRYLIGLA